MSSVTGELSRPIAADPAAELPTQTGRRYARLELLDRHSAETLNAFCQVTSTASAQATRLANVSAWQAFKTSAPLALVDVLSLYVCLWAVATAAVYTGILETFSQGILSLAALTVLPLAQLAGIYPGLGQSQIVEFRQIARTLMASVVICCGVGVVCLEGADWPLLVMGPLVFASVLPTTITFRFLARQILKDCAWWGVPTLIVAEKDRGIELYRRMAAKLEFGFKPVGVFVESGVYWDQDQVSSPNQAQVPLFHVSELESVAFQRNATWVVISGCAQREVSPSLDPMLAAIPNRLMLASGQLELGIWDQLFCIQHTCGIRVGAARPNWFQLAAKRCVDLVLTSLALIVGFPFLAALCMAIKFNSRGPIFYGQKRIGRGGVEFQALKFRTMQVNADQVLEDYLERHPAARAEWEEKRKLSNDPRVTSIGKLLRTTSLDELPQLWNVLKGEMSLVGPRPIVDSPTYDAAYIHDYPHEYELYKSVRPGLTGLWQVESRNRGVYELRIYWDMYYIRNWCLWLDLYLIMRTVKVMLFREGS